MDRRHHNRYELKASVTFRWNDAQGNRCSGRGELRDISEKGVFVFADTQPAVGTIVRFDVLFNSFRDGSTVTMDARGTVVRVERGGQEGSRKGFAAVTKSPKLRDLMSNGESARRRPRIPPLLPNSKKTPWLM